MVRRPLIAFIVFVFAALVLAATTLYQFHQAYTRQALHTQLSAWALAQMELETIDFRNELALYLAAEESDTQSLILTYDILWSRYDTFLSSHETAAMRQAFDAVPVVKKAFRLIRRHEQAVLNGNRSSLQALLNEIDIILPQVRDLMVNNFTGSAAIEQRQLFDRQLSVIYAAFSGLVLLLIFFAFRLYRFNHKQQKIAWQDRLTGLPNRNYLLDCLQQAAAEKRIHTLLLIDIRRFKDINDLMGYDQGDAMLVKLANELRTICLPYGYPCARLNSNEFAVLTYIDSHHLSFFTQPLCHALRDVIDSIYPNHRLSIAIGIAKSLDINTHEVKAPWLFANQLLNNADLALMKAKQSPVIRDSIDVFKTEYDQEAQQRRVLREELKKRLQDEYQEELYVMFQPIVSANPHRLGCEALIRWHHPQFGSIDPQLVIEIAEESGMAQSLGAWILGQVNNALNTEWQSINQHIDISVNLSDSFFNDSLISSVITIFAKHPEQRKQLIFEVTETMTMDDIGRFSLLMNQLRDVGIRISLDDFGTGWSSIAILNYLNFDKVKIDRSFIKEIIDTRKQQVLVDTICHMAHQLGIHVVAEGVETQEQLISLQQIGVDEFQGYFFAKPLTAIDFYAFCIDYLNQKNTLLIKN
ncbi:bifunctional diguanylate cyclase/phosphodiesterase [Salinivibrio sp. ES.052]|uniref:putative bifunctional diguanylate cyclase/phosphodiesterase n=1 Tax=Salinivibrio sp. ES.052 TaxID=1882823 RepID=UPI00092A7559|nr:GGDEF domain-containing phosphodiesterase [Salinivibrio sp. ES.052]SIO35766.1 diguanylate cyclase/phosphodiesterase [Salinivibrio sp. ES.052]